MKRLALDPRKLDYSVVRQAGEIIKSGGLVAFPTETVYGLAARADNEAAVKRLYEVKGRKPDKPFSYAVSNTETAINKYFIALPSFGYRLIEKFWPGPLTIVYFSPEDKKIGVRVPANIIAQEIIRSAGVQVFLPSANISGEPEPLSCESVERSLGSKIDMIVDGGECVYSTPSTVIDITFSPFKILREGAVLEKNIVEIFIRKRILMVCAGNTCRSPMAEMLLKKYLEFERPYFQERYEILSCGLIAFGGTKASPQVVNILKENEGIDASGFFSRKVDKMLLLSSDLIFTMEESQKEQILKYEPATEGRVFTLGQFISEEKVKDIPDPMGHSDEAYQRSYELIKQGIWELKDWL